MKTRIQLALMGCLASIGAFVYLTLHFYPIKFGFATGNSVCNLSAKFDCDAVAASSFASIFGMPIALWGAAANVSLFCLMLFSWLEWSDHPERLKRWTALLAGLCFAASVVMATISFTMMQSYCLFCISVYVLSAIVFFSFKGLLKEPFWSNLTADFSVLWPENKGVVAGFVAIPILAYMGHQTFMQNLGDAQVEAMVSQSLADWQASPKQNFVAKPTLTSGPAADNAAMTLVEFADFRCGHCRHAMYTLDAFVKSHPDVRFEFYSFPLDGACNEKIEASSGLSCRLAVAVLCADQEGKGWELHHALYDHQDETIRQQSTAELDPLLAQIMAPLGLNWERMQTCMNNPASQDAVRAQAKQGGLVNVQGTPTIFANGRQLNGGQILPVLQAVRKRAIETKTAM